MSDLDSREYVLKFDARPEFLRLVDEVRKEMPRDEFLCHCMERGLGILFREANPHLNRPLPMKRN